MLIDILGELVIETALWGIAWLLVAVRNIGRRLRGREALPHTPRPRREHALIADEVGPEHSGDDPA